MRKLLVLVAALALSLGSVSAAQAAKKFTVTTTLESSSLQFGQKQRVTGTVSPKSPGKTVKIYVHYATDSEGEYHYVGKKTLSPKSTFVKTFAPADSGTTKVKVVKAASGSRKSGSSTRTFKNFGYMRLSDLPSRTIEAGDVANDNTFTIGEYDSDDGYRFAGGNGRARWSTAGQCKKFYAFGGVPDGPASADTEAAAVLQGKATANGEVLTEHETPNPMEQGDLPDQIELPLSTKVGSKTVYARYLTISTQEQGGTYPRFGLIDTDVLCNLPGADTMDN